MRSVSSILLWGSLLKLFVMVEEDAKPVVPIVQITEGQRTESVWTVLTVRADKVCCCISIVVGKGRNEDFGGKDGKVGLTVCLTVGHFCEDNLSA